MSTTSSIFISLGLILLVLCAGIVSYRSVLGNTDAVPDWVIEAGFASEIEARESFQKFWESAKPAFVCCAKTKAADLETLELIRRLESCHTDEALVLYSSC